MASILRVNTLTDASSGNSTAMSTVNQGTAKAWSYITGTGFTLIDNFNVSSTTDNATGRPEITFSNNMLNATYTATGGAYNRVVGEYSTDGGLTTTSAAFALITTGGTFDDLASGTGLGLQIIGDLA